LRSCNPDSGDLPAIRRGAKGNAIRDDVRVVRLGESACRVRGLPRHCPMRRAEQAIPRTHRSVPRHRPMCRVEWRLVAGGEVGSAAALRAVCQRSRLVTQDPAPDKRYRAGVDPSRLLAFALGMALSAPKRTSKAQLTIVNQS
jgi:hypothetical protein